MFGLTVNGSMGLKQQQEIRGKVEALVITTTVKQQQAEDLIVKLRDAKKEIERELTPSKDVAYAKFKAECEFLNSRIKPINEIINIIKEKIAAFVVAENDRRRIDREEIEKANKAVLLKADKEIEKAVSKGNIKEAQKISRSSAIAIKPVEENIDLKATRLVDNWQYEIIDASAVPDKYLIIDHYAIKRAVEIQKEFCCIPGIRVWNTPKLSFK